MANEQDDLAKLSSLNKQFTALFQVGKFNEAIPIAQEFLELSEKALDPHHPDTAQALNNLAALYASLGDYAKAEPFFERALNIREKALGTDHPLTGDYPEAVGGANADAGMKVSFVCHTPLPTMYLSTRGQTLSDAETKLQGRKHYDVRY